MKLKFKYFFMVSESFQSSQSHSVCTIAMMINCLVVVHVNICQEVSTHPAMYCVAYVHT